MFSENRRFIVQCGDVYHGFAHPLPMYYFSIPGNLSVFFKHLQHSFTVFSTTSTVHCRCSANLKNLKENQNLLPLNVEIKNMEEILTIVKGPSINYVTGIS